MNGSLLGRIKRQIERGGPISVADYMAQCLSDPHQGYYTTATPFGKSGDFITAPEISQMFGELIGVWCVAMWRNIGAPKRFNLVEMGPGRGTLMADLLRAAAADQGFLDAANICLVEISEKLRTQQSQLLAPEYANISWMNNLDEIGEAPTIFIGNEFLDALPFHQYVKSGGAWLERMVGLQKGELAFVTGIGLGDVALMPADHKGQKDGVIFETAPAREAIAATLANHIQRNNGAALLIDYGHLEAGFGDTFQALSAHEYVDPLKDSGKADLTSHVDFSALAKVVRQIEGISASSATQGDFLLNMGLLERAGSLGYGKSTAEQQVLRQAVERLAGVDQMGHLFKVIGVTAKACKAEGFDG